MRILITGANGMLGKSLQKELMHHEVIQHTRYVSSLSDMSQAHRFYDYVSGVNPDYIVHTAALVGGLNYNKDNPYDFSMINTTINNVVLDAAVRCRIPRFLGVLSVCCYGDGFDDSDYPLTEDKLFMREPHPTNALYAYSKRCLAKTIMAANQQFGHRYNYIIPTNLYGEYDNRGNHAHFCSMMIDRVIETVKSGSDKIDFFGDGNARRQYIHVDDLAKIIRKHIELDLNSNYNVASEEEMSAQQMVNILLTYCGQQHIKTNFMNSMAVGQSKRTVSTELMRSLHPDFRFIPFYEGVVKVYNKWKN